MKTALIIGISGQDGCLLANFLLDKKYKVWGTSRNIARGFGNLNRIGICEQISVLTMQPEAIDDVRKIIDCCTPDEIYFLSGQSSVGLSFECPRETMHSIVLGPLNVLEVLRLENKSIRFFYAGSGECYGDTLKVAADEKTPFSPKSPYAVAKASATWLVRNYRESYGLFACTGILFNHESTLRTERFVTQKIIHAARRIAQGSDEKLYLGRLDVTRDWGWASEYVEAMWLMLQSPTPEDFVIATGQSFTLAQFVDAAFVQYGLNWGDHVVQDTDFFRPTDIETSLANPSRIALHLDWRARYDMHAVIKFMSSYRLEGCIL